MDVLQDWETRKLMLTRKRARSRGLADSTFATNKDPLERILAAQNSTVKYTSHRLRQEQSTKQQLAKRACAMMFLRLPSSSVSSIAIAAMELGKSTEISERLVQRLLDIS